MREKKDFKIRTRGWHEGPIKYDGLLYYSPFTLLPSGNYPILKSKLFVKNSVKATIPQLTSIIRKSGFASPDLVWLTNPIFYPLLKSVYSKKVAVRVADDITQFKNIPEAVKELELSAIARTDATFIVSKNFYENLKGEYPNTIHLPNGVDFKHFQKGVSEPEELKNVPRPRVIYVGSTEYWLDADLIEECALKLNDIHFLLVGPRTTNISSLSTLENVHILGSHPYESIPAYLEHSDVGIIPFKQIPLVDSIHPIKLYEYLAAGLPVVATRWKEIEDINPPAYLTDRDNFTNSIKIAYRDREKNRDERIAFAKKNSWNERYETILNSLELKGV